MEYGGGSVDDDDGQEVVVCWFYLLYYYFFNGRQSAYGAYELTIAISPFYFHSACLHSS
jgi:hypothetical protein